MIAKSGNTANSKLEEYSLCSLFNRLFQKENYHPLTDIKQWLHDKKIFFKGKAILFTQYFAV